MATGEWGETFLALHGNFVRQQEGPEVDGDERGTSNNVYPLQAAVHGSFWLGLELTRVFSLAPSWVQWSAAWAAATSRHETIDSSSLAVVMVTAGTHDYYRVKDLFFIFELVQDGLLSSSKVRPQTHTVP